MHPHAGRFRQDEQRPLYVQGPPTAGPGSCSAGGRCRVPRAGRCVPQGRQPPARRCRGAGLCRHHRQGSHLLGGQKGARVEGSLAVPSAYTHGMGMVRAHAGMELPHVSQTVGDSWMHLTTISLNLQAVQVGLGRDEAGICNEWCWPVLLGADFSPCSLCIACASSWGLPTGGLGSGPQGVPDPSTVLRWVSGPHRGSLRPLGPQRVLAQAALLGQRPVLTPLLSASNGGKIWSLGGKHRSCSQSGVPGVPRPAVLPTPLHKPFVCCREHKARSSSCTASSGGSGCGLVCKLPKNQPGKASSPSTTTPPMSLELPDEDKAICF